ncbi:MAG: N-acetylmuramic acid 6-phosphate etherase [Abditibacteriales bacterium]|nr:N-acetylmuramic acid 6-phosphate etherase [Abditibacteriales bacterium]MDW8366288.1 N-acetylmuramic acid 6-phosphate etherase [Abditibacteriales bacterium]
MMSDLQLRHLTTEARNPASMDIDKKTTLEMLQIINDEDKIVAFAVEKVLPSVARAVDLIVPRLRSGGRLFYIGAGTSGRLGIVDASECPPTFGTPPELVQGIIAGGRDAVFRSQEGAEDDADAGERDLAERGFTAKDVLVGLSASGRTPYVLGALRYARRLGALTIGITCNDAAAIQDRAQASCLHCRQDIGATLADEVDVLIAPIVGPEVITGSTRMKAGTAQKMILNMLSTVTMIQLGRVQSNLMVDMQTLCGKLRDRARRVVALAAGVDEATAEAALQASGGRVREAIESLRV